MVEDPPGPRSARRRQGPGVPGRETQGLEMGQAVAVRCLGTFQRFPRWRGFVKRALWEPRQRAGRWPVTRLGSELRSGVPCSLLGWTFSP